MNWKKNELGNILKSIKTGSTPSTSSPEFFDGSISWFTPADIGETKFLEKSSRTISELGLSKGKAKLFPKNSLLVTCIGNIGRVGILNQPASSNQQITSLNFKSDIDINFAYYWFLFNQKNIEQLANQAVVPILNNERLQTIEVSYPLVEQQKRIAAILDKADRLRRQRRFAQTLSDSFLQSVFIKMFGDPVSNPMNWETNSIGKYTSLVSSGSTPLGGETVYKKSGVRFIRSQNVLMSDFDFSDIAFIDEEIHKSMKRTHVKKNDVLINITGASIGRVACYKEETIANVNQHVCIIRLKNKDILPSFLSRQLSMPFYQTTVISSQSGATRQAFNFEQIKDFQIVVPPLPLQEKFAEIVQKFERVRRQQREATRLATHLFQTLLHRAFRGEL
jgi:type I restriction enzyme S subunit